MIKLIKSTFYDEKATKKKLIKFLSEAKQLSFGEQCGLFEKKFAKLQERDHCIFVSSGSAANLALIQALLNLGRIKKGDFVGFSALTWSTNVMPLIQLGLNPVPIDVSLRTLNVTSAHVLDTLKKFPIKALFVTNLLGFCDDLDMIANICRKEKIHLIEDNCESMGSRYKGKKLGNFSLASTFSFYVGHHMSTIEGGAICTGDEELSVALKLVRAHGWDRNLSLGHQANMRNKFKVNSTFYSRYTFYDLGYNLRPTEISGFLGNEQLRYANTIVRKRQANFLKIAKHLYKLTEKYYPIAYDHMDIISNFAIPLVCKTKQIRDELVKKCNGKVEIRPIVGGAISQQPFFKKYVDTRQLPSENNARLVHQQGLYFGNNPELTQKEIIYLISLFGA